MNNVLTFRRLVILQIVVIAVMLYFGLRPKGLTVHNQVQWIDGKSGIRISDYGMVYADVAALLTGLTEVTGFSIEMAVRSASDEGGNFKSLVMLHNGSDKKQLIVGQWKSALIVMNGDDYDNSQRTKKLISKGALKAGNTRLVTVVTRGRRTELFLDGKPAAKHEHLGLAVPQGEKQVHLVLGNSVYGRNGWDGEVLGMAVYGKALDARSIARHHRQWSRAHRFNFDDASGPLLRYQFNDHAGERVMDSSISQIPLLIPSRVTALKRTFLSPPWHKFRFNSSTLVDIVLNFFGFAPMGLVAFLLLTHLPNVGNKHRALTAIGACLLLSLVIESIQMWMPSRTSSMLDLILNTTGGAAGAGLWFVWELSGISTRKQR